MYYSGSNIGNGLNPMHTDDQEWMGRPFSISLTVPPLAGIVLKLES
jgi:1,4-alpha-glucan branching enzyme